MSTDVSLAGSLQLTIKSKIKRQLTIRAGVHHLQISIPSTSAMTTAFIYRAQFPRSRQCIADFNVSPGLHNPPQVTPPP